MKISEIRDKNSEELVELETELRDQLIKIQVAHATQRTTNTANQARIRKDIARIHTVRRERSLGVGGEEAGA